MSPRRQQRGIVESLDDESLPETWEEMQRNIEPVSPAAPEQRQVITIDDDDGPQEAPLGDEPPFEVLLSMMADAPVPPQEPAPESRPPEPESQPPEPEPESRPPEPESEPAPEPAPESPQPGPSGLQEPDDTGNYANYSEYYLNKIDECAGTLKRDNAEFKNAKRVITKAKNGLTGIHVMLNYFEDTVTLYNDYKEAYRVSRRVHKRKLDQYDEELESNVRSETKKFKDECDAHAKKD